ncbi:uncharacterized protein [Oscarella lobularis]|uniref:uncharacterized protein n=1 Tax=Oscarella lobularis TaxID=121494 RepID=UPI0033137D40
MYVFAAIVSALFCVQVPASAGIRYQPIGGVPYSVSSLTDCQRPTGTTHCTFPADYTVPVSIANRLVKTLDDSIIPLYASVLSNDSAQCSEAVINVLCDLQFQPKCLGNGMVAYDPDLRQRCYAAFAKCGNETAQLSPYLCANPLFDFAGIYSMTKCVTPNVNDCINTASSPEWIAYYAEKMILSNFADATGFSSKCTALFARFTCTLATCGSNNQLLMTLTRNNCEAVIQCAPADDRTILQQALGCDDFPTAAAPTMRPSQKIWLVLIFLFCIR